MRAPELSLRVTAVGQPVPQRVLHTAPVHAAATLRRETACMRRGACAALSSAPPPPPLPRGAAGRRRLAVARAERVSRRQPGRAAAPPPPDALLPDEVVAPLPWDAAFCQHFLQRYWQRRLLLVRQAVPNFQSPLDADELAGLACEVPARIILEQGGARPWELRRGPFEAAQFASLPETHWTLVVNGVDRAVPAVADTLLPLFAFLPSWRVDDVQVSYAPPQGSVGAHSDQYDVFLLQADGRKAWAISEDPAYGPLRTEAFAPGLDVAVLAEFTPQRRFELQPGDMLYLPPGVAHHGVALEAGFTYSIGFLAPTRRELFLSWASAGADADPRAAERWADPWLTPAERPGQLSAAALDAAAAVIASLPQSRADIAAWFGAHVTTPRDGGMEPQPLDARPEWAWVLAQAGEAGELCRHEGSRFAFLPAAAVAPGTPGGALFVDGRRFAVTGDAAAAVAAEVADHRALPWARLQSLGAAQPEAAALLQTLLEEGLLFIPTDEEEEGDDGDGDAERVEEYDLEDEGAPQ